CVDLPLAATVAPRPELFVVAFEGVLEQRRRQRGSFTPGRERDGRRGRIEVAPIRGPWQERNPVVLGARAQRCHELALKLVALRFEAGGGLALVEYAREVGRVLETDEPP